MNGSGNDPSVPVRLEKDLMIFGFRLTVICQTMTCQNVKLFVSFTPQRIYNIAGSRRIQSNINSQCDLLLPNNALTRLTGSAKIVWENQWRWLVDGKRSVLYTNGLKSNNVIIAFSITGSYTYLFINHFIASQIIIVTFAVVHLNTTFYATARLCKLHLVYCILTMNAEYADTFKTRYLI